MLKIQLNVIHRFNILAVFLKIVLYTKFRFYGNICKTTTLEVKFYGEEVKNSDC